MNRLGLIRVRQLSTKSAYYVHFFHLFNDLYVIEHK